MKDTTNRSLNALKHGASAKTLFLPTEDPAQFDLLLDNAFEQYQPANFEAEGLVYDSVEAKWYLTRRQTVRADYELLMHTTHSDTNYWPDQDMDRLERFDRYCTTAERAFRRALVNVRFLRTEAVKDEKWRELLVLRKESLQFAREKFANSKANQARRDAETLKEDLKSHRESSAPIQPDNSILQRAFISFEDGITLIDQLSPSNDEVRKLIENDPNPVVVRHYTFLHDIPEEYRFLVPNGFTRNATARYEIRHQMDAAQFSALARREDEQMADSDFSSDESEISDEDWIKQQRNKTK